MIRWVATISTVATFLLLRVLVIATSKYVVCTGNYRLEYNEVVIITRMYVVVIYFRLKHLRECSPYSRERISCTRVIKLLLVLNVMLCTRVLECNNSRHYKYNLSTSKYNLRGVIGTNDWLIGSYNWLDYSVRENSVIEVLTRVRRHACRSRVRLVRVEVAQYSTAYSPCNVYYYWATRVLVL